MRPFIEGVLLFSDKCTIIQINMIHPNAKHAELKFLQRYFEIFFICLPTK